MPWNTEMSSNQKDDQITWDRDLSHVEAEGIELSTTEYQPVMAFDEVGVELTQQVYEVAKDEIENSLDTPIKLDTEIKFDEKRLRLRKMIELNEKTGNFEIKRIKNNEEDPEILKSSYKSAIIKILDDWLVEETREKREEVLERHKKYSLPVYFSMSIEPVKNGIGSFSQSNKKTKIDPEHFEVLDPKSHIPQKAVSTSTHEFSHGIHYHFNPFARKMNRFISHSLDRDESYTRDVRRATLEDISQFEETIDTSDGDQSSMEDPLNIPWLLSEKMDIEDNEESLYADPYSLGKLEAELVDLALREKHGDEEGRELAREYLLYTVTTPKGVEGAIESALEILDLPNYHEEVERHLQMLSNRDPIEGAKFDAKIINRELEKLKAEELVDKGLESYYSAVALYKTYMATVDEAIPKELGIMMNGKIDSLLSDHYT